jgi:uncharacterized protein
VSLRERLQTEMTAAMRAHDGERRDALRMILASVQRSEKDSRHELSDDEALGVLARELRTRMESVEAFRAGGRDDLAQHEEFAIKVIGEFMPERLDEAELEALVDQAIASTGAAGPRDMGKVMGWLSPKIRGRADGKHVSHLVTARLATTGST